jgi:UDP:flavonoid glycosyltransferase YjiC (YdhE family)
MRYLFCTHANHGSLGPSILIARNLIQRGHEVAFVSDVAALPWLNRERIPYIPNAPQRLSGFDAQLWFDRSSIILQCAYIMEAARTFIPDIIVGHQLTVGPYITHEVLGIPLAVIGLAAWMYPTRSGSGLWLLRNETHWRHDQFIELLQSIRESVGMSLLNADMTETPLQGDVFLLRTVPTLERNVDGLPSRVNLIGAAIEPLPAVPVELGEWLCNTGQCLYVQQGRTFDCPGFLETVIAAFVDTSVRVVVDSACIDRNAPKHWPSNFFAHPGISTSAVLKRASAVLSTGHSTTVLSALCHGVPMLLFPNGSGTTDIAARCLAANVAIVADAGSTTPTELRQYIDVLCYDNTFRDSASQMLREFARYDSPTLAGNLLEELGSSGRPVLRSNVCA